MTDFQISEAPAQRKPISLAAQLGAVTMVLGRDLRLIFPGADPRTLESIKAQLDAAANTLSQLTDW